MNLRSVPLRFLIVIGISTFLFSAVAVVLSLH
jgi:hypothetical protein